MIENISLKNQYNNKDIEFKQKNILQTESCLVRINYIYFYAHLKFIADELPVLSQTKREISLVFKLKNQILPKNFFCFLEEGANRYTSKQGINVNF